MHAYLSGFSKCTHNYFSSNLCNLVLLIDTYYMYGIMYSFDLLHRQIWKNIEVVVYLCTGAWVAIW